MILFSAKKKLEMTDIKLMWGHVGLMLALYWAMLGLAWAIWRQCRAIFGPKISR